MQTFGGYLSTRHEKVSGIVNISTMAGHAAQQHVLLECLGIGQMVNTMRSSIPDHRLDTTISPSTPSNVGSPKKLQTVSVISQSSRFFTFAQRDYRKTRLHFLQPSRCNGKDTGVHSVLRSGVESRCFAHIVVPLGALPSPLGDVAQKPEHCRQRTQCGRSHMSYYADGGRALELLFNQV